MDYFCNKCKFSSLSLRHLGGLLKGESHVMELLIFCRNPGQTFGLNNKKQANLIALGVMPYIDSNSHWQSLLIIMATVFLSGKIKMLCILALPLSFKYRYYNPIQILCPKKVLQKNVRPVKMKATLSQDFL